MMVIARMPEDLTFQKLKKPPKPCKAICTCMCTPVGPTDILPLRWSAPARAPGPPGACARRPPRAAPTWSAAQPTVA
eukprot:1280345-Heterocapsa_arctica.AAC.1